MIIFLDFEASSLGKRGFPVEVGWVTEDGGEEGHLTRPAPDWDEWDAEAESIHGIPRERLLREGSPHDVVAHRMVEALSGHDLFASAPSWDGQWLSRLLRAAGLPRHALRLRDTEEAQMATALAILRPVMPDGAALERQAEAILRAARDARAGGEPAAHRAVADAWREMRLWQEVRRRAKKAALAAT